MTDHQTVTENEGEQERTPAQNAQLALLLEVASTPKPGNVDREREYADLRFEHFLAGAVGALEGFERAAAGDSLGVSFEQAVAGMKNQRGGNTQFGAILLLTPLVAAAGQDELTPEAATARLESTTVDDAVAFYRAFEHVDVSVRDPPEGLEPLDVRRGGDAEPTLRDENLTLVDVMEMSADRDGIAAELTGGFERTFEAAEALIDSEKPLTERAAAVYLALLSSELDTFVIGKHDYQTALEVRDRAQEVLDGTEHVADLAEEFIDRGINPGTTADIVAGALFVALESSRKQSRTLV